MTKKQRRNLIRIITASFLLLISALLPIDGAWRLAVFLVPYFISGYDILRDAVRGIINRQPFDENFLMAAATVGAFALGEYSEGVFVMLFYQIGELFQSCAVGRSRKNIASLMDIRPDYANVKGEDGEMRKADPYELAVGDVFYVLPGEKIPLDGTVVSGESVLDTVALTGESVPRGVKCGDAVLSGCINLSGLLEIRAVKPFETSTASRILDLVENASSKKSRSEKFISKFAKYYTPIVCISACALALFPPLFTLLLSGNNTFGMWIYRALTFLVISCPCALVVSVPLSFFAGIGCAGKHGILVKGANYLEALSKSSIVVFDKTGTLTRGVFEVTDILCADNMKKETLLEYAVLAESYSNHPISESLKKSYKKTLDKSRVSCFTEMSGLGVSANVDGKLVLAGNSKLLRNNGIDFSECEKAGTAVYVAVDGVYAGHILVSDVVKENSAKTVSLLKKNGIGKCVMLTGDRKSIGEMTARELGIDEVYAELLPGDKVSFVESLLKEKKEKEILLFAGDGINDAPVLARADVGIAMGALGADAAIEAADVVLMDDDPLKIVTALKIAKKCMAIVYQNIYFAIGIKLLFLILGAVGSVNMWLAVFADVGVMVLAVLNAVRALKV